MDNSRPVSILSAVDKLFEKIVSKKKIWNNMENKDLLIIHQLAYRSGYFTTRLFLELTHQCLAQMDKGNIVGTLFIDFSATFDRVDHDILVENQIALWLPRNCIKLGKIVPAERM